MTKGELAPEGFNVADMVFILKDEVEPGCLPHRGAAQLRTLSLSNTDQKVIASAIAVPMQEGALHTVHEHQTGGLKGRKLEDCLLRSETNAVEAATLDSHAPAWLFTDIKAAFPSLHIVYFSRCYSECRYQNGS